MKTKRHRQTRRLCVDIDAKLWQDLDEYASEKEGRTKRKIVEDLIISGLKANKILDLWEKK